MDIQTFKIELTRLILEIESTDLLKKLLAVLKKEKLIFGGILQTSKRPKSK